MLRIHGLTKRYGTHAALQLLSVQLMPGDFVALLGPNGADKSTLFQVLTGLFAVDEGGVDVAGHSLRNTPAQRCASSAWCSNRSRSIWT